MFTVSGNPAAFSVHVPYTKTHSFPVGYVVSSVAGPIIADFSKAWYIFTNHRRYLSGTPWRGRCRGSSMVFQGGFFVRSKRFLNLSAIYHSGHAYFPNIENDAGGVPCRGEWRATW